jgi:hypothetical protein
MRVAMSDAVHEEVRVAPASGTLAQRLRLASGLVLFLFLFTHLGNHALGLISVEAMQWARTLAGAEVAPDPKGRRSIKVKGKTAALDVFEMKRAIDIAPEWTVK